MMSSSFPNRVTSAPYRFPEQTASQYHAHCSASPHKERATSAGDASSLNYEEAQKISTVVQDEIWKTSCSKEKARGEKWKQNWGFLTQYDQKGNPREPKQYPEQEISLCSTSVPNTSSAHYGHRVGSANAAFIKSLERTPHNLRKTKEILYCE